MANVTEAKRKEIVAQLFAIRDDLLWYEDALGLDSTEEKAVIDTALDPLMNIRLHSMQKVNRSRA